MIDIVQINAGRPGINVSGILAGVPGIFMQNHQSSVQGLQISSNGFSTRFSFGLRGIRLLADGIHASMPEAARGGWLPSISIIKSSSKGLSHV